MRLQINDEWVNLPSSLSEITLKQRIHFQQEHGDLLNEMLDAVNQMPDGEEKELEIAVFHLEKVFRSVAFFTNVTVEALKQSEFVDKIINYYSASIAQVFEDEMAEQNELKLEFVFNKEEWEIHPPELKNGSHMTFAEFIDSKQMIQDMIGLGKGRWECLLPLCAIFLRRKDEPYEEAFLYEDSERLRLMENLPLDIALQVGFFLNSSLTIYKTTFLSSFHQELKVQEIMSEST